MQYSSRFFISWLAAAIIMYASFVVWHGVYLNDLTYITFSQPLFFSLAGFVYLVISYVLYRVYEAKIFDRYFYSAVLRGVTAGFIVGVILFAIIAVLGISFTKNVNTTYLLADCLWQIAEQSIGGVIIGFGKLFLFEVRSEAEYTD